MNIIDNEAFERLRASRRAFEASDRERGRRAGRKWALDRAEWEHLNFVAEAFAQNTAEPVDVIGGLDACGYPLGEMLALFGVDLADEISRAMIRGFLESVDDIHDELAAE